ncbi:MAG TPA: fluoride efflux transporter CrcB [Phycisphaerae bacterium]|nr:fluoride efflux transporter CrcB [Phycisphaerae bacterium]
MQILDSRAGRTQSRHDEGKIVLGSLLIQTGWVGLGGAVGSMLRFALAAGAERLFGAEKFPIGTMLVNVLGSMAIGYLTVRFEESAVSHVYRVAVLVGLLGGFTTFSSFSLNTIQLIFEREYTLAIVNVVGSVLLCLAGCWLGFRIARGLEAGFV